MDNHIKFNSLLFRPVLPEESQVNPGRYGAELAFWLCTALAKQGVVTSYPNYEDWGWFVEFTSAEGKEFRLCCGNIDATDDEWQCFWTRSQANSLAAINLPFTKPNRCLRLCGFCSRKLKALKTSSGGTRNSERTGLSCRRRNSFA